MRRKWNYAALLALCFGALVFWVVLSPAMVRAWQPSRPIAIVLGATPGGAFDTVARHVAQYLPEFLGTKQPVLINNMPGAGDRVQINYVRRSKPDGTILGLASGDVLQQIKAFKYVDYDPIEELTILGGIWTPPPVCMIVATHPAVRPNPLQTWEELKKVTKPVRIASYGNIGEMALIPVFEKHRIPYIIVPGYEGLREAGGALLRGEGDILTGAGTMVPLGYVKDGTAVPLMVVSKERYKGMPEIGIINFETAPTVVELGVPEFGTLVMGRTWIGPKKLPPEVEKALSSALKKVSDDPRTLEWCKKVKIPMTWIDVKTVKDAHLNGLMIYDRFSDIGKKIGLVPEQKK